MSMSFADLMIQARELTKLALAKRGEFKLKFKLSEEEKRRIFNLLKNSPFLNTSTVPIRYQARQGEDSMNMLLSVEQERRAPHEFIREGLHKRQREVGVHIPASQTDATVLGDDDDDDDDDGQGMRKKKKLAAIRETDAQTKALAETKAQLEAAIRDRDAQAQALAETKAQLELEIARLKQKVKTEDEERRECVTCFRSPRSVVLLPCKHFCLCSNCPKDTCPICREDVRDVVDGVFNP